MSGIDERPAGLVDNVRRRGISLDQSIKSDASTVVDFINGLIRQDSFWIPSDQYSVSFIQDIIRFTAEAGGWTMQYHQLVAERVVRILNR